MQLYDPESQTFETLWENKQNVGPLQWTVYQQQFDQVFLSPCPNLLSEIMSWISAHPHLSRTDPFILNHGTITYYKWICLPVEFSRGLNYESKFNLPRISFGYPTSLSTNFTVAKLSDEVYQFDKLTQDIQKCPLACSHERGGEYDQLPTWQF